MLKSDSEIQELIRCRKIFRSKPRKPVSVNKNITQKFNVYGETDHQEFSVFISHSQTIIQDFSIGLVYENMLLYRCNGFHGTTRAGYFSHKHHAYPHSHTLTLEDIENAREKHPSQITDLTGKYVDLNGGILHFFINCGIINYTEYFPNLAQLTIFDL